MDGEPKANTAKKPVKRLVMSSSSSDHTLSSHLLNKYQDEVKERVDLQRQCGCCMDKKTSDSEQQVHIEETRVLGGCCGVVQQILVVCGHRPPAMPWTPVAEHGGPSGNDHGYYDFVENASSSFVSSGCSVFLGGVQHRENPASERTTHYTNQQSTVVLPVHHLTKRSFFDIQCKGVYDKSIFARLDRLCEDCYNLFREPQIHTLCRSQCFSTQYFKGCLESLLLTEESDKFNQMVEYLGKRSNN
ncbi:Ion transport peptide [Carabus blaptoides fortunei]